MNVDLYVFFSFRGRFWISGIKLEYSIIYKLDWNFEKKMLLWRFGTWGERMKSTFPHPFAFLSLEFCLHRFCEVFGM